MNTRILATIITLFFAAVTFLLGPILWPMVEGDVAPAGLQLPLLILVSAIESIAFGLGVSFLVLGWPWVKRAAHGARSVAWTLYVSITWFLVSWWPHDRMHMSMEHDDFWSLIGVEYAFHVTLIAAGAAIAYHFFTILRWSEERRA